jgi:Anti-sigma factor NepR
VSTEKVAREKVARNREVREALGQRLREHYDFAQRIAVPDHLAELVAQLEQRIETTQSETEQN